MANQSDFPESDPMVPLKTADLKKQLQGLVEEIVEKDEYNEILRVIVHLKELKFSPQELRCPISKELMKDPVILVTGKTYDRPSIRMWLNKGYRTCPITQKVLPLSVLTPNVLVRELILQWRKEHRTELTKHVQDVEMITYTALNSLPKKMPSSVDPEIALQTAELKKQLQGLAKEIVDKDDYSEEMIDEVLRVVVHVQELKFSPQELRWPISNELMKDPVILTTGKECSSLIVTQIEKKDSSCNEIFNGVLQGPDEFKCPISKQIMKDPVMVDTGKTFDRTSICECLEKNRICPLKNGLLDHTPNDLIRDIIFQWRVEHDPVVQLKIVYVKLGIQFLMKLDEKGINSLSLFDKIWEKLVSFNRYFPISSEFQNRGVSVKLTSGQVTVLKGDLKRFLHSIANKFSQKTVVDGLSVLYSFRRSLMELTIQKRKEIYHPTLDPLPQFTQLPLPCADFGDPQLPLPRADFEEHIKELEELKSKDRSLNWLHEGIVVRIKSTGALGFIVKLINPLLAIVKFEDTTTAKFLQNELETIIPKTGSVVKVVNGCFRGTLGDIICRDEVKGLGTIKLCEGTSKQWTVDLTFEDFSQFQI